MIEGVIYRYKSPSGKYYIGQTINEESRRYDFLHKTVYAGQKINRARRKYGPENFEYVVLMKVTGDNQDDVKKYLDTLEIGFIKMYDTIENGYNSCEGGDSLIGYKMTEEHRQKLIESHKGLHPSEETNMKRRNSLIGKKHNISEEGRKKLRDRMIGNRITFGRKHTEESIEKMRQSKKGQTPSNKGKHKVMNPDGSFHYE